MIVTIITFVVLLVSVSIISQLLQRRRHALCELEHLAMIWYILPGHGLEYGEYNPEVYSFYTIVTIFVALSIIAKANESFGIFSFYLY